MRIRRTANAGVLLELDGVSILLDGVCREVKPYPATPPEIKAELMERFPDGVAFTHDHKDHYDPVYAAAYLKQSSGVILGPEDCYGSMDSVLVGGVQITPVPSRHIGAAGKTTAHTSFILEGSHCVWFTGDASPMQWRGRKDIPKPDILLVPYAYAATPAAWSVTQGLGAQTIVILHLPDRQMDDQGLWDAVETTAGQGSGLIFPAMNANLLLE